MLAVMKGVQGAFVGSDSANGVNGMVLKGEEAGSTNPIGSGDPKRVRSHQQPN